MVPLQEGNPIRELVLVDAHTGNIPLHFNQIDNEWETPKKESLAPANDTNPTETPTPTEIPPVTETPVPTETSLPAATEFPLPTNQPQATNTPSDNSDEGTMTILSSNTWYVATTGSDLNSCSTTAAPCQSIQAAINKSSAGDTVKVTEGTYIYTSLNSIPNVAILNKSITLSGGWKADFSSQTSITTIDGQNVNNGILVTATGSTVVDKFIIQHSTSGDSGAIYHTGASLTLKNSTLKDNTSSRGAGIFVINNAALTVINSTISNNTALSKGGGIYVDLGTVNIEYSTIAYNTAPSGTGGGTYRNHGSLNIHNSILANNSASVSPNCNSLSASNYNIINSTLQCTFVAGDHDRTNVDPKVNGSLLGLYPAHYLLANSQAIDAGDPVSCSANTENHDERGVPRPQGTNCDIGAVEYGYMPGGYMAIATGSNQATGPQQIFPINLSAIVKDFNENPVSGVAVTFTAPNYGASGTFTTSGTNTTTAVTNSSGIAIASAFTANSTYGTYVVSASANGYDSIANFLLNNVRSRYVSPSGVDSGSCDTKSTPCLTIQKAVDNASAGEYISVATGTYTTSGSSDIPVVRITKNLNIGGGWNNSFTARDGQSKINGENVRRGVQINNGVTVTMDRLDIYSGKNVDGAGISNGGTLTFTNGAIYNNSSHRVASGSPSNGGGIFNNGTLLTLTNVTISNNEADVGGGLFISHGNTILNNVTISQNLATNLGVDASGGGIENANNSSITIYNTIIAGNAAEIGQDCHNLVTSGGNNLIGYDAGCNITPIAGDIIGHGSPLNAKLGDLADNSSYTKTHALLTGSPAINAGNPSTCVTTDQRGIGRPQGAACDIGAFEGSVTQTISANIKTYSAENLPKWPGTLLCDSTHPECTNGADPNADQAYRLAADVYQMYLDVHGRISIDNNNMPIISTVHYCSASSCPYANAFWSGAQMVYGDAYGFTNADDIVAHELTHGVTQYEFNLYYFYQSGAINESLSDLWGEYFDQTNGIGNDTPEVKWLLGEDVTGWTNTPPQPLLGQRSMSNPPAFGDPDKMTSSLYYKGTYDNGGVHWNSGVNNKAVFLMVDGGAFNGKTVIGIGWDKTEAIYYEVQTNLLTSGSDYSDLYYALQQACTNLIGQEGISSADCTQVKNAIDAVQMNSQPVANFNPDVPACPAGMTTRPSVTLFQDDFENGSNNWSMYNVFGLEDFYASSGTHMMWGNDKYVSSESAITMKNGIYLQPGTTPFLFFKHAFAFEYDSGGYYDGGVLEYSKDGGNTWLDAKPLFSAGQNYNGTVYNYPKGYSSYGSALQGRSAFVGDSHGYVSSRYDLKSLTGQTVKFRWRFATDWIGYYLGWFVDDVSIYQCIGAPGIPALQSPVNNALITNYTPLLNWSDATPAIDHYQVQIATDSNFTSLAYDQNDLTTSEFTVPTHLTSDTKYYWRVRSFNALDGSLGWSPTWSFRIAILPPDLAAPSQDEHILSLHPTFNWNDVPNATGYMIQISTTDAFVKPIVGNPMLSTFTPATDLPKGVIYWRVQTKGANGPSAWSEVRSYNGINAPSAPVLSAPATNLLITDYAPTFAWASVVMPGVTVFDHYQIQVDDDSTFGSPNIDEEVLTNSYSVPTGLSPNTQYYWRVRAVNTLNENGDWSTVFSFRTALTPPNLSAPADAHHELSLQPSFSWQSVSDATSYTIQISTDPNFPAPAKKKKKGSSSGATTSATSLSTAYAPASNLAPNATYYWRIQANGTNGPSDWSEVRSFTSPNAPSIPLLSLPAANALTTDYSPTFKWSIVSVPLNTVFDHYQLQVDDDPNFGSPVIEDVSLTSPADTQLDAPLSLTPNTTFYWHVRAFNTLGEASAWSTTLSFRTALTPPNLSAPADAHHELSLQPSFDWEDVPGAAGYTIQVSRNDTFTLLAHTGTSATSSYAPLVNLPASLTLYWRVQSTGANGPSAWSQARSFIITEHTWHSCSLPPGCQCPDHRLLPHLQVVHCLCTPQHRLRSLPTPGG